MYEQARNNGRAFDLVIMDLAVSSGMDGKEAVQKLRELDPQVKAIVSSGYSTDPVMADYRSYGFIGVITKPYGIKKMAEVVQSYLPA